MTDFKWIHKIREIWAISRISRYRTVTNINFFLNHRITSSVLACMYVRSIFTYLDNGTCTVWLKILLVLFFWCISPSSVLSYTYVWGKNKKKLQLVKNKKDNGILLHLKKKSSFQSNKGKYVVQFLSNNVTFQWESHPIVAFY